MTSSVKLLVAFFVLTLISCDKDLFPEDLQVHFEDNFPIKDIVSRNGYWLACGGETFESGYVISSQFENEEAFIVSIHSKCVNSIDI